MKLANAEHRLQTIHGSRPLGPQSNLQCETTAAVSHIEETIPSLDGVNSDEDICDVGHNELNAEDGLEELTRDGREHPEQDSGNEEFSEAVDTDNFSDVTEFDEASDIEVKDRDLQHLWLFKTAFESKLHEIPPKRSDEQTCFVCQTYGSGGDHLRKLAHGYELRETCIRPWLLGKVTSPLCHFPAYLGRLESVDEGEQVQHLEQIGVLRELSEEEQKLELEELIVVSKYRRAEMEAEEEFLREAKEITQERCTAMERQKKLRRKLSDLCKREEEVENELSTVKGRDEALKQRMEGYREWENMAFQSDLSRIRQRVAGIHKARHDAYEAMLGAESSCY